MEFIQKDKFIEENPKLEAYVGAGFMRSSFDKIGPRKESLDELESEKPVILTSMISPRLMSFVI